MFKEKLNGLKFLFSDPTLRGTSIISILLAILLVSGQYLSIIFFPNYVITIGIISYLFFQYIFWFLIIFNFFNFFTLLFNTKKMSRTFSWIARFLTIIVIMLGNLLFFLWFSFHSFLVLLAFFIWTGIESFYFCKFAFDLSNFTKHKFVRIIVYVFLVVIFTIYLVFSLIHALHTSSPSPDPHELSSFNTTVIDWLVTLFLMIYSVASMGEHFIPADVPKNFHFKRLSPRKKVRVKNLLLMIFFMLLGFELFLRGLPIITNNMIFSEDLGMSFYYQVKLFFFVPFAIGFMIAVFILRAGKKKK
ncbi:MAG: hypothetical protein ACTSVI_13600 [Promethearchaeota archaeon]